MYTYGLRIFLNFDYYHFFLWQLKAYFVLCLEPEDDLVRIGKPTPKIENRLEESWNLKSSNHQTEYPLKPTSMGYLVRMG
jgi:hypothetical protein